MGDMALDLTDYSSNPNDLTNHGATESTDTPFASSSKSALFTRSSSQYADITDAAQTGLDLSTTFTIEFWIKFNSLVTNQIVVAKEDDSAQTKESFLITLAGANKIYARIFDGAGHEDTVFYGVSPTVSTWEHYAITCNASNATATTYEFFKNGSSVGNGTVATANNISTIYDSTAPFAIGARFSSGSPIELLDAYLDEVRVWNTIRTSQQISDNYQLKLNGDESGLVAYYPFEPIQPPNSIDNEPSNYASYSQGVQIRG